MHKHIRWGLLAAGLCAAAAVHAGPSINVSVAGEVSPGVYGRVDIGNAPPPRVLYPQPVVIVQQPRRVHAQPVYLHVPPGHAKNWSKHCRKYDACGTPVYFVKSAEYEPGYQRHEHKDKRHNGRDRDHAGDGHRGHDGARSHRRGRDD